MKTVCKARYQITVFKETLHQEYNYTKNISKIFNASRHLPCEILVFEIALTAGTAVQTADQSVHVLKRNVTNGKCTGTKPSWFLTSSRHAMATLV